MIVSKNRVVIWETFLIVEAMAAAAGGYLQIFLPTYLMLMRYCASATDSALPVMVMVRSVFEPGSLSSQLEMRIIAPLSCLWARVFSNSDASHANELSAYLISAILEPPLPMMQPMSSLGTVISWVCWLVCGRLWWPEAASAARAGNEVRVLFPDLQTEFFRSAATDLAPSTIPIQFSPLVFRFRKEN